MNCKAENYYIVDPTKSLNQDGWKAPGLNEWLKLTPVVGQNGVYTIDLPANYPGNMKYNVIVTKNNVDIQGFINAKKDIPGFSFAIASYSQIERCAKLSMTPQGNLAVESNKDKVNAIKAKFLAPSCTGITTPNYQVNKVSESGTLTTYGENSNKKWEIITPLKKSYSPDEFDYSNYYKAGENGYDCGDKTFLQLKDDVFKDGTLRCLDGTYRLTIDLNNNTWTMEYLNDRRVAYLTTLPLQNKNIYISDYNGQYDQSNCYSDYQAYSTATLTQMKGEGEKFTNIFYNPNVYLKNNTRLLYMSQFEFDDGDVTHYINGYYTSLKKDLTQEQKLNIVMSYAYTPSYIDGLLHPYTGSFEGKKIVINDSLTFNCAHLLNKETNGTPTPMKEEGYYTSLHLYPFLKGGETGGVIVFGDGTQEEDKPLISNEITLSYYWPSKDANSGDGCSNIEMPYDQDLGLYKRSFGQRYNKPAKDIPYCFWTGSVDQPSFLWVQDAKGDPNPTPYCEEDADFLEKVNGIKKGNEDVNYLNDFKYYNDQGKMIHYYGDKLVTYDDVTIYFKIGVAADGKTPTYKYWLERPITIDVPFCQIGSQGEIGQHHGMNIRTFCSDKAYNIAPSDDEYETKIYTVSDFVKTENKGTSDNNAIAKATLTEVHHIPANTGVILISKTKNGLNKYNDKDGTVHVPLIIDTHKYNDFPKNYLVGVTKETYIKASDFDKNNKRTARNFFLCQRWECTDYVSNKVKDYLGFFRSTSKGKCEANHAYLKIGVDVCPENIRIGNINDGNGDINDGNTDYFKAATDAKGIELFFDDDNYYEYNDVTSGVSEIHSNEVVENEDYYTLTGIKVSNPSKGIYIHNGKKIYIK